MTQSAKWTIFALASTCAALVVWIAAEPRVQAQAPGQAESVTQGQAPAQSPVVQYRSVSSQGTTIAGRPRLPGQVAGSIAPTASHPALPGVASAPASIFPQQEQKVVTGYYYPGNPLATTIRATSPEEQKLIAQTHEIIQKLRQDDEEMDEAELKSELRKVLEDHFELRMTKREEELEKLEERLDKLRDELSNRRSAKNDIIDLRHQSLVNEAQGLGF